MSNKKALKYGNTSEQNRPQEKNLKITQNEYVAHNLYI